MNILEVRHVSKRYKSVRALADLSFAVPEGSIYGILGPNGSGKTTLLGIITGVLGADAGEYELFEDTVTPKHILRRRIGTLLETPNFYHYLSARDNLRITAGIKGTPEAEIDAVLEKVGLAERQHSKFSTFSLGMKQRLAIGAALLGNPRVLILDEPMNGLDPEGIVEVRELVRSLAREGRTVIMASHLLDEVEKVCTHVAILKKGELLAEGIAMAELAASGRSLEERFMELVSKTSKTH
jgi:ABC-2 type transport system ATP-binding protein